MLSIIGAVVVASLVYLWLSGDEISIKIVVDGKEKVNYKSSSSKKKQEEDEEEKN